MIFRISSMAVNAANRIQKIQSSWGIGNLLAHET
jgi:hypothetical protein